MTNARKVKSALKANGINAFTHMGKGSTFGHVYVDIDGPYNEKVRDKAHKIAMKAMGTTDKHNDVITSLYLDRIYVDFKKRK